MELALALPVLIFLLFAIMESGRIFGGYVELQHAARDGARYASVNTSRTEAEVKQYIKDRLVMLNPQKLDENSSNFDFNRLPLAGTNQEDRWVEITLIYPLEIVTPIVSSITGNPFKLKVHIAMRSE